MNTNFHEVSEGMHIFPFVNVGKGKQDINIEYHNEHSPSIKLVYHCNDKVYCNC